MVLKPLEFVDCLSDSPWFRQNLREHESVLEAAHRDIKNIELQCRELIQCTKKLSAAQRAFAKALKEFHFITVGSTQTDDERKIVECLSKYGDFINQIEDHREKIVEDSEKYYIEPIKKFRVEGIGKVLHDDKKRFEKESRNFYVSLEKYLHLSTARKNNFEKADEQLSAQQEIFCKCGLDYVTAIQSIQERMKFEFVETLSSFLYSWLTFYHVGHVTHQDFKPYLSEVQSKVQKAKQSFEETKEHYEQLKEKMLRIHLKNAVFSENENDAELPASSNVISNIKQGYVFLLEKSKIPKTIGRDVLSSRWTKYYCVYQKETRILSLMPVNSTIKSDMKDAIGQLTTYKLKSCTRRASDSIDKRFCFDISVTITGESSDRDEMITLQALSEEDRRQWLDAMDGREPIYSPGTGLPKNTFGTVLDEAGFDFVSKCLSTLEERGIREQGLYRNCGVTSKVQKLMQIGLDKRRTSDKPLFGDENEWEIKTISSAVKTFLRNLPEPLMTFDLHHQFINAAKMDSTMRVSHIHFYVHQLPKTHFDMLKMVIKHLRKVADHDNENKMTVGNLGVCFGPTLLRPKEETNAAILDIKFCNVVVEVLIANYDTIFNTEPRQIGGLPCPPKPGHVPEEKNETIVSIKSPSLSPLNKKSVTACYRSPIRQRTAPHIYERSCDMSSANTVSNLVLSYEKPSTSIESASSSSSSQSYASLGQKNKFERRSGGEPSPSSKPDRYSISTSRLRISAENGGQRIVPSISSPGPSTSSNTRLQSTSSASSTSQKSPSLRTKMTSSGTSTFGPYSTESRRVKTLYECTAGHDSELSFQPGQIITNVYESKEEGWLVGTLNGKTGLIPANYVEPLP